MKSFKEMIVESTKYNYIYHEMPKFISKKKNSKGNFIVGAIDTMNKKKIGNLMFDGEMYWVAGGSATSKTKHSFLSKDKEKAIELYINKFAKQIKKDCGEDSI